MRTLSWWVEWPAGLVRVGVAFVAVMTALAGVYRYPGVLLERGEAADRASSLSYADREVAGGNAVVGDQQAAYQARARIPESSTFRVAVGEDYEGESDLTARFVSSFFRYFLMPRRPSPRAPWVICYGCDLGALGPRARVVWESPEEIAIVRLGR